MWTWNTGQEQQNPSKKEQTAQTGERWSCSLRSDVQIDDDADNTSVTSLILFLLHTCASKLRKRERHAHTHTHMLLDKR